MNIPRLRYYCQAAGAFLLIHQKAEAQVDYTNIDPDVFVFSNDSNALDFNNDGIDDVTFRIERFSSTTYNYPTGTEVLSASINIYVSQVNGVMTSDALPNPYKLAHLQPGDEIGPSATWNTEADVLINNFNSGDFGVDGMSAFWKGADAYVGVRFLIGTETHYGWVRLAIQDFTTHPTLPSVVLMEMGYEETADAPITITSESVDVAKNVWIKDEGETGTPSDLVVHFEPANNESEIAEYRIYLQRSTPTVLSIEEIKALPETYYVSVTPQGTDYAVPMTEILDLYYNSPIIADRNYTPLVLSVPNGLGADQYNISVPGNYAAIYTEHAGTIQILTVNQVDSSYASSDFSTTFEPLIKPENTDHYRIFITDQDTCSLETLLSLPENYYTTIAETGMLEYTCIMDENKLITFSGQPALQTKYYSAIICMPDTIIATFPRLYYSSDFYRSVTYFSGQNLLTPKVTLNETNYNGSDIHVTCNNFSDESKVNMYFAYIVPEADTSGFTHRVAAEINAVDRALPIYPTGEYFDFNFPADFKDINGNTLTQTDTYFVYISAFIIEHYSEYPISYPSNAFTLSDARMTEPATIIVYDNILTIYLNENVEIPFQIHSIDCKLVYMNMIHDSQVTVDLSSLPKGAYVVSFPYTQINPKTIIVK